MVGFDLDVSRSHKGHRNSGDDKPEGKGEECLFIREHVEERGEPRVELVKCFDGSFLFPERYQIVKKKCISFPKRNA